MIPVPLTDKTRSMTAPADWDESRGKCLTLDIHDGKDDTGAAVMVSAWTFEPGELEKLAAGAPLYLRIYGTNHPVVSLHAGDPTMSPQ
jgi:hypothetical protein